VGHLSLFGSMLQRDGRGVPDCAQRPVPLRCRGAELGVVDGRPVAEAAVRSDGVVVETPFGQGHSGMGELAEQGLVQQPVT
jgi:hypothetical protein